MFTLTEIDTFEQEIKRSRFLAVCGPVRDEEQARQFIQDHSFPDATHNCWAWRIGQNYRFNDDGEPSGTAGKPILQAMDGLELDQVAVVVTRWFGGTLLGSGGLIRAYGGTAALCLRAMERSELVVTEPLYVRCHFSDLALLKSKLPAFAHVTLTQESFHQSGADLYLQVPVAVREELITLFTDLTSGRVQIADNPDNFYF